MPKITFSEKNEGKTPLLLPVFSDEFSADKRKIFRGLSPLQKRALRTALKNSKFPNSGFVPIFCGKDAPVFVQFLGKKAEIARRDIFENAQSVASFFKKYAFEEILILSGSLDKKGELAFSEGVIWGSYEFLEFFGKKTADAQKENGEKIPSRFVFFGKNQPERTKELMALFSGVSLTKNLINTPPSVARPSFVEERAREIAKNSAVKITVFGKKDLEKMNCGGILAVGRASREEPRLIVLEYRGGKKTESPIALVGKGVTFDTGGHNIKGRHMRWMKQDLGGAATVLGHPPHRQHSSFHLGKVRKCIRGSAPGRDGSHLKEVCPETRPGGKFLEGYNRITGADGLVKDHQGQDPCNSSKQERNPWRTSFLHVWNLQLISYMSIRNVSAPGRQGCRDRWVQHREPAAEIPGSVQEGLLPPDTPA